MICRICTNGKGLGTLIVPRAKYVSCPMCRCLFVDPYPAREENQVFRGPEVVSRLERVDELRRAYFNRKLNRLEDRMGGPPNGARLLEVGCGTGILLQEARGRGWSADAVELSAELAARARENNPGAVISTVDIQDHEPDGRGYDALICLDVLEHVLSPLEMVENCRELLKPGGLLLLQTPNTRSFRARTEGARWDMLDPAQHLNLFSSDALRVLLTTVGFEVLEMITASGSGQEKGAAQWLGRIKESVLGFLYLGNALVAVGRRPLSQ